MIRDILVGLDAWHAWWMAFWYANPILFAIMALASVAFAVWVHGRKP